MNEKQVKAIKFLISRSNVASIIAKIFYALLDASEGFTKEVRITSRDHEISTHQTACELFSDHTYINTVMAATGTDFRFSQLYGEYDENGNFDAEGSWRLGFQSPGVPIRFTYWLGKGYYSSNAENIVYPPPEEASPNSPAKKTRGKRNARKKS